MNVIKEAVKKHFSNKTKEELLDMVADLYVAAMNTNVIQGMVDSNFCRVNEQQQKVLMDAINGDCTVKNPIDKFASLLTTKIKEGGI